MLISDGLNIISEKFLGFNKRQEATVIQTRFLSGEYQTQTVGKPNELI